MWFVIEILKQFQSLIVRRQLDKFFAYHSYLHGLSLICQYSLLINIPVPMETNYNNVT